MNFFGYGKNRSSTQKTAIASGRIALKDRGDWSVTASAAYRRLTVAAGQIEYEVARNKEQAHFLSGVIARALAAKIAYGITIIDVDSDVWQVLDNDRLEIIFGEKDQVIGFKYRNLAQRSVDVKNFLYSAHMSPGRVIVGALQDAASDITAENVTQAVAATIAENFSYIGLVAYCKGVTERRELQKISDAISGAFTGEDRGGVLAISDNVKIEPLLNVVSLNPIGVDNLRASRQAIAAAFGVPYDLLYSDSSNRASVDAAKDLMFRDTLVPAAKALVSDFGNTRMFGRISLSESSLKLGQSAEKLEADAEQQKIDMASKATPVKAEPAKPAEIKPLVELKPRTA